MADLLLVHSVGQDWQGRFAEALSSAHCIRSSRVKELDSEDVQSAQFDLSITDLSTVDIVRLAIGTHRLGELVVVAAQDDEQGRVSALASGAADCVAPDVPAAELRARVAGILRRRAGSSPGPQATKRQTGRWYLNLKRRFLISPDGSRIELPGSTFEIFSALATRPQRTLSRSFLIGSLNNGKRTSARNIDVVVTRLRQTLDRHDPSGSSLITTIRSEGYQFSRGIQRDEDGILILDT